MIRPLHGLRVLDLSRLLPGPLCSMHLADWGADVLKIEDPEQGDYARWTVPMLGQYSHLFHLLNRGKRSVALDLRSCEVRTVMYRLVEQADVLLESYRPGLARRMGLDWETLHGLNPRLVYVSITGYGQTGPMAHLAAHDLNLLALSGVLHQTGTDGGQPVLSNFQMADVVGGAQQALSAVLAALWHRERTGQGQYVDVSMLEGLMANAVIIQASAAGWGQSLPSGQDALSGALACYNVYATSDARWVALAALEPKFWARFCEAVQQPGWVPRQFALGGEGQALKAEVAALFATATREVWTNRLVPVDCCFSPVLSWDEALQHPQVQDRALLRTAQHPTEGQTRPVVPPVFGPHAPGNSPPPAPNLGQHTRQVMLELGYTEDQILRFVGEKTIRA